MTFATVPRADEEEPFVVLGANIATSSSAIMKHEEKLSAKQERYFELLRNTPLHPQVAFTLLRICGSPRILYHCAVTPPAQLTNMVRLFDKTLKQHCEWLLDTTGQTKLTRMDVYSRKGLGMSEYGTHHQEIFERYRSMALNGEKDAPRVSLYINDDNTLDGVTSAQLDAQFLFFNMRDSLTPAEFRLSLMVRLNKLTIDEKIYGKCNCGVAFEGDDAQTIEHILRCDMSTGVTHSTRHNLVRDAIISTARQYGLTMTKEPSIFAYANGKKQRPDIMAHTMPMNIVTDVTLVHYEEDMQHIEKKKTKIHSDAVNKGHGIFIPFVMHTRGTLGTKAENYIRSLAKAVQPCYQVAFARDVKHAISVAAAKGRAHALSSTMSKHR